MKAHGAASFSARFESRLNHGVVAAGRRRGRPGRDHRSARRPPRRRASVSSPSPPTRTSSSVAAVGDQADSGGRQAGGLDHVVAGQGVDRQPVVRRFVAGDVDLRGQSEDRYAAGVAGDEGDVIAIGAGDDHRVGLSVAARRRRPPG